jgi:large subunit ribosomal protein L9
MKIILRQPVEKLGQPGDIVSVKSGYARNYLIPDGFAYPAEGGYLKRYDQEKKKLAQINMRLIHDAEALKALLEKEVITFTVKVDEEDKLYGSVNPHEILVSLAERGLELERKQLGLDHPLKELGETSVAIKLHTNVTAQVKVIVAREAVELEATEAAEVVETVAEGTAPEEAAEEATEVTTEEVAPEETVVEAEEAPEVPEAPEDPETDIRSDKS